MVDVSRARVAVVGPINHLATRFIWALSAPFLGVYAIVQNISIPVGLLKLYVCFVLIYRPDYITTTAFWSARGVVLDSSEKIRVISLSLF
jgi:hypothetical protein